MIKPLRGAHPTTILLLGRMKIKTLVLNVPRLGLRLRPTSLSPRHPRKGSVSIDSNAHCEILQRALAPDLHKESQVSSLYSRYSTSFLSLP